MKRCKDCHSTKVVKAGTYPNKKGRYQLWRCNACGRTMKGGKIREKFGNEPRKIRRRR